MNIKLHTTVLLNEAIQSLKVKKNGIYLDGTFGAGGHSKKILEKLGTTGKLYAIDQDPYAVTIAKKICDDRFYIIPGNFSHVDILLKKHHLYKKIDGIILDLGMSSMQLISAKRGFSFNINGPLDMRMNPNNGISAHEWINTSHEKHIYYVLKSFGEERFAKKIANKIIIQRKKKPISTTFELSNIIQSIIPKQKHHKHPATKSFQAIRIFINQELQALQIFLNKALNFLKHQGRISVISFHSLEDRIVKQFINQYSQKPNIPYNLPINEKQINQICQIQLKKINRIFPTNQEINNNFKSRSAVLRTAEFHETNYINQQVI
ncbi:16S rRNA (cytosine(1402)-N(4))-methyltransferase RsmH [Buchnera aphidicola (Takecallis taiwana)]|uniref:16S rRNA (cytosine(1402)-N(4))-methyltransferase RsmH n=1 Tax=Buchnera aphidicola TaxID=9 RepID=UPI0031B6A3C6